jgi:tetratricopeptide (TPR) repeat protein
MVNVQPSFEPFGPFLILRPARKGGMGEVHLAFDRRSGQLVALKRVLAKGAGKAALSRFRDEIENSKQLQHPNLVRILDSGEVDGTLYLAMEYLVGIDLNALADRARRFGVVLPVDLAVSVVQQICAGLAYAHSALSPSGNPLHFVHRDVSLGNIMLGFNGRAHLIDFGISKSALNLTKTQPGGAPGALAFASPEQLLAQPVDHRSDLYSLGVVFWTLVAGSPPFPLLEAVKPDRKVPRLSSKGHEVPPGLDTFAAQATAFDPTERFQSAAEMAAALERYSGRQNESVVAAQIASLFGEQESEIIRELGELKTQAQLAAPNAPELAAGVRAPEATTDRPNATMVVEPLAGPLRWRQWLLIAIPGALAVLVALGVVVLWRQRQVQVATPVADLSLPVVVAPPPDMAEPQEIVVAPSPQPHPPSIPTKHVVKPSAQAVPENIAKALEEADRLIRAGRQLSAEEIYARIEQEPGGRPYAMLERAHHHLQARRFEEAISAATEATHAAPPRVRVRAFLIRADAELKMERGADAVRDFEKALALDPTNDEAKDGLAAAQRATGAPAP